MNRNVAGMLIVLASLGAAPDFSQIGFSTINALGDNGTTGGGDLAPIVVHNAAELQRAAERLDIKDKTVREQTPRVVQIANDIDLGELQNMPGGNEIKDAGIVRPASGTTIYATGAGATIRHGTFEIHGRHNIIIRNLIFRDLWEFDPTGEYDKLGWDYVRITRQTDVFSHHVWVDHCDFGKVYDGQVDIVHGSDFVTVSWCKFAGDERGPQKKVSLVGHGPNNVAEDKGRLNVTFHHNWYENIEDRAPRARFGNIHSFNNYINGAANATMSVVGATTLIEHNYYKDVSIATSFSHASDTVAKGRGGTITIVDSLNANPRPLTPATKPSEQLEQEQNFKSNIERAALQFSAPAAAFEWPDRTQLPYRYDLDPAADVPAIVMKYAERRKALALKHLRSLWEPRRFVIDQRDPPIYDPPARKENDMPRTSPILYLGVRGTVVALDRASGHEYWRTTLKGWDFVNLTLDGDSLFAATRGELFCLDPMTGHIRWNNPLRGLGYGLICIAGTDSTAAIGQHRANAQAAAANGATAGSM